MSPCVAENPVGWNVPMIKNVMPEYLLGPCPYLMFPAHQFFKKAYKSEKLIKSEGL
jgi:hypothetical protein